MTVGMRNDKIRTTNLWEKFDYTFSRYDTDLEADTQTDRRADKTHLP